MEDKEISKNPEMKRRLVILESPFGAKDHKILLRNLAYARLCLRDSLSRGEAPIASHLLYPQVLNEQNPEERELGISAGLEWTKVAERMVVYVDFEISPGMKGAIKTAELEGLPVEFRMLPGDLLRGLQHKPEPIRKEMET